MINLNNYVYIGGKTPFVPNILQIIFHQSRFAFQYENGTMTMAMKGDYI